MVFVVLERIKLTVGGVWVEPKSLPFTRGRYVRGTLLRTVYVVSGITVNIKLNMVKSVNFIECISNNVSRSKKR